MAVFVLSDTSGAGSWIADYGTAGPPAAADMATVASSLDDVLSADLHGAQVAMGCSAEDLLLAALGRAIARTIGEGMLVVDVACSPGRPGVRRVGVPCVSRRGLSGSELLAAAHPNAGDYDHPSPDVGFAYGQGAQISECGYPLTLHIHSDAETAMRLHWRFDTRGFDPYTVEELAEQFPLALIEVASG